MRYFFQRLGRSIGVFFRTLRAFFSRKLMSFVSGLRRLTNFSRHATKAASASLQGMASATQNPSKPSDYVETKRLMISKSLIIRIVLIIIALALIGYFVVWPFVLSHFLTARFYVKDKRVEDWSGRVIVFSDEKKTVPLYAGRLEDGVLQGDCKLYDENGVLIYEGQLKDGIRNGNGKAYENGVLQYDGRFTDGIYDGFGTLYKDGQIQYSGQYDKGKRTGNGKEYQNGELIYDGQFQSDLYEGHGKQYEDGALVYDGQFQNDLYEGHGKQYKDGTLVYDGQFQGGIYEGRGKQYENGELVYDGQFQSGVYEGRGQLYRDNVLIYDGVFHAGKEEGSGTAYYYPSGKISYQGMFLAGLRDGDGVAYNEDGSKLYEGGFAEDVYSGDGTLYFDSSNLLLAKFAEGVPTGIVKWMKNGFLYYQGEWADDAPNGFGTLYNKAEKSIYEGPFLGGTLDGLQILGKTTDEFRGFLGKGSVRNAAADKGFLMIAEELGLTALCSFRTDKDDPRILKLFLSAPANDDWVQILPGMEHTQAMQWPADTEPEWSRRTYTERTGVQLRSGVYESEFAEIDKNDITVLYADDTLADALLLIWERADAEPTAMPAKGNGKSSKVNKLLNALDKMIRYDGTAGSKGATFGGKPTDEALKKAETADDAVTLADAMIEYWVQKQRLSALDEMTERNDALLSDEKAAVAKGQGSEARVKELEKRKLELKAQSETTQTAIKRASLQAQKFGIDNLSDYALEEMLLMFDPGEQDISGLEVFAISYMQAIGSEKTESEIKDMVKEGLLNLSDAHTAAELALKQHKLLDKTADDLLYSYSMGVATKAEWFAALDDEVLSRVDLYVAMAAFSSYANHFNQLTGGWVCRTFDWHKDVFEELLEEARQDDPTPEPTEEPTPTPEPTEEPTPTPEPSEEPTPTPEPSEEPTPTPDPTEEPTPTPDPTEEPTPTPDPTEEPTPTPDPTEEPTPTPDPTEKPTSDPTSDPDESGTDHPDETSKG